MVWPVRGRAEKDGGRVGMKIGGRIRELRATRGMSQDDLAARVYVSRQTISSWENGKTYPDVQSLLLLSEIFGASVDSLIKGDVNAMNETIDRDAKTMKRLTYAMLAFLLLMIAALAWGPSCSSSPGIGRFHKRHPPSSSPSCCGASPCSPPAGLSASSATTTS